MRLEMSATVDLSGFEEFERKLIPTLDRAVRKTAAQLQTNAKFNVKAMGAVDTGALGESIYVVTSDRNTFEQAAAEARKRRPESKQLKLEIERSEKVEAYVAVGQEYGIHVEYGTRRKDGDIRMAARPFLRAAINANRGTLKKLAEEELRRLKAL